MTEQDKPSLVSPEYAKRLRELYLNGEMKTLNREFNSIAKLYPASPED